MKTSLTMIKLTLLSFLVFGCQTKGYFIQEVGLPVSELRKMTVSIIGAPQFISENGRELFSAYHDSKLEPLKPAEEDGILSSGSSKEQLKTKLNARPKTRYETRVIILGTRRPYEINTQVWQFDLDEDSGQYISTGVNDKLSRLRAVQFRKALNKGRASSVEFDGESPF